MKILAILQNQWFKNPKLIEKIYERHGGGLDGRAQLNATYLFFRCLTGKRLTDTLGEDLCDRIIWENASTSMGGESAARFGADPAHIVAIICHHKPTIIITFGAVAESGLNEALRRWDEFAGREPRFGFEHLTCCHPAARQGAIPRLRQLAAFLTAAIAQREAAA